MQGLFQVEGNQHAGLLHKAEHYKANYLDSNGGGSGGQILMEGFSGGVVGGSGGKWGVVQVRITLVLTIEPLFTMFNTSSTLGNTESPPSYRGFKIRGSFQNNIRN